MKIEDEKRTAQALAREIGALCFKAGRSMRFMEVCGTHTMAIHALGCQA